jgi:predicted ATPase/DNA-binding CsgD family transcriptional regulator/class 3 adenylate cyclase
MFGRRSWFTVRVVEENVSGIMAVQIAGAGVDASEQVPAAAVTLLLVGIERPTQPAESGPEAMMAAMARLEAVGGETIARHGGKRQNGHGDDDGFMVSFSRTSDAVACALDLQGVPLAPLQLRICLHTGEVQPRDRDGYLDVARRAARLLELAHGGQTLLSGATCDLVADCLPDGAWLADLGGHRLPDLARPVRVMQLCHPGVRVDFPALRSMEAFAHNLPVQLTSFIGRAAEMTQVRALLQDNRLVTLTGAGGVGKTRLALQVAAEVLTWFPAGVWHVDLGPVTEPAVVAVAVARALGLSDEAGQPALESVAGFLGARHALVVLDNCEHLLEPCAVLAEALLRACPGLVVLATSREPVGVAGEAIWRVPSLPLATEAAELFADRAQRARPGFAITAENGEAVAEICRRLDGIPLAIELAAARLRAFSPAEIAAGLHDRFRLLTGGSRTAVRRQQTLRASVDWSHALLTEPERILFRRLASFAGGFDLEAAQAVGAGDGLDRHQVPDQLALLVDKSLVAAEESQAATRYRLLETIRQYAAEKLGDSGEAGQVRTRHRDHFAARAARLGPPADGDPRRLIRRLEADIDNLRAAFGWSLELSDAETALRLTSSLQPLWLGRCRMIEGLASFDAALAAQPATAEPIAAEVRARALTNAAVLADWTGTPRLAQAEEAVALAREFGDPVLLGRALVGAGFSAGLLAEAGRPYFTEASALARQAGDEWTLAQILGRQGMAALISGDLAAGRAASEEGLALAERSRHDLAVRMCKTWLGAALLLQGDLSRAKTLLSALVAEAEAERVALPRIYGLAFLGQALALMGQPGQARAAGEASIAIADSLGFTAQKFFSYDSLCTAAMACGDDAALREASQAAWQHANFRPEAGVPYHTYLAHADLAGDDLGAARQHAEQAVATATKLGMRHQLMCALLASARVATATGDIGPGHDDAHQALTVGRGIESRTGIIDALECLGGLSAGTDDRDKAARLFGAADALRRSIGYQRFALHQSGYDAAVTVLRASMGEAAFGLAWDEGAALTLDDAVNYALRGRGERNRPAVGWLSLTPAERDVARLVAEGLANKEIAARLFVSPRTVQTHLTHMYGKLGLTSRVQLAQQAARHV